MEESNSLRKMPDIMSEGVQDMAKLPELNQSSILCNLNTRYQKNEIYVSTFIKFSSIYSVLCTGLFFKIGYNCLAQRQKRSFITFKTVSEGVLCCTYP